MTDVSNLDELANKIAGSSPNIKNYAKAQATATQAQEAEIQKLREDVEMLRGSSHDHRDNEDPDDPPPPPPPPPPGTLTYVHDYTAARGQATPPSYGWTWGFQGYDSTNVGIVPAGYSSTLPSLRMHSPLGYTSNREGLYRWPATGGLTPATAFIRQFFGFGIKFYSTWPTQVGSWGGMVMQLGYAGLANHNLGFWVGSTSQGAPNLRALYLNMVTGYHQPGGQVREWNTGFGAAQGPPPKVHTENEFPLNTWLQFICDIQWSTVATTSAQYGQAPIASAPAGHMFVYYRHKGASTWTRTVNFPDCPTMQWGYGNGEGATSFLSSDLKNQTGGAHAESHKFGFYGGSAAGRQLEHANICWGTTFEVVEAKLG